MNGLSRPAHFDGICGECRRGMRFPWLSRGSIPRLTHTWSTTMPTRSYIGSAPVRESVLSSEVRVPCSRPRANESTSSAWAIPRLRWSRRTASRSTYAVAPSSDTRTSETPTTAPSASSGHPQVPRLEPGPAAGRGGEVLERLPVAHRPLEEGVLQDVVGRAQLVGPSRADDVAPPAARARGWWRPRAA